MGARTQRLPSNPWAEGRGRRGCSARSMRSMRNGARGSLAPAGHRSPAGPQDNDPSAGAEEASPSAALEGIGSNPAAPAGSTIAGREVSFTEEDLTDRDRRSLKIRDSGVLSFLPTFPSLLSLLCFSGFLRFEQYVF